MLTSADVRRVNILFIIMQMGMGGSERLVHNLISKLDRKALNPSLAWFFGDTPLQEFVDLGIPLYHIPKNRRFDFSTMRMLGQIIKKNNIDVVNAHHFMSMVYAFYGCKVRRQSALIYTEHSEWEIEQIPKRWRAIGNLLLRHINHSVGVTSAVTDRLRQVFKVSDGMASTVLNGVNVDKFKSCERKVVEIKNSLNIEDGEQVIGTVGNLKGVKNHKFLIRAFSELAKVIRNVRLVIIGQGFPGDPENSEQELKDQVRKLGVVDRVSFLGYRCDVPELLSIMDVFCLTSLKEGLPTSLIEAMAAGLPVVGTNVEGIRDVIVPNQDGLLVELGDVESLKKSLSDLLKNPDRRAKLGQEARQKAEEKYSLQQCVLKYEALFLSTLHHARLTAI
jgi:glycosyltransferase involved in cell wall biosynthesis